MTDTDVGMLWFVGDDDVACEILNDNRTRHYQSLHPLWRGTNCVECECEWLNYNPCFTGHDETPPTLLVYGDTPADVTNPAPWFDELAPASAEFLGWMVDTVDGFDYSHYSRTINQRAGNGANLTPLRAGGREITYTLIGTALTERGMVYGLHWLAAMLASIGGRCGFGKAVVRTHCDAEDITGGLYELREVAVHTMPEWTEKLLADNGCLVRGARFSIVAGDPCMYGCRSVCLTESGVLTQTPFLFLCEGATPAELLCGPMPVFMARQDTVSCCEIEAGIGIDSMAATVQIDAIGLAGPFTIETYSAMPGTDCVDVRGNEDLFIGRVSIGRLSPGQSARIDGAAQQVYFRGGPNSEWEPDDSLLLISPGEYPCFPRLSGCDSMYVLIRPAIACPSLGEFTTTIESVAVTSCSVC